jgi:N-acetylmuramoyl-L-alanine amidase
MKRARTRVAWAALLAAGALLLAGSDWRSPPRGEGPETIPVRAIGGDDYVAVNDLARLLDATKFWRSDVRKLVLRTGTHSLTLTVDDAFVVLDNATVWLPAPVRSQAGEIQVPVALIERLPADSAQSRLYHDARRRRVIVLPSSGGVDSPRISVASGVTRVTFPADRAEEIIIVARSRAHFRVRFGGLFTGVLPDSMPEGSLVRAVRSIAAAGGSAFELAVAHEAVGFRVRTDTAAGAATLEFFESPSAGLEEFAPEGPAGPRQLRTIVLDPGHGGTDPGVISGRAVEKDLTLALARLLRPELERRLGARVVLTRDQDRDVSTDTRAELANRMQADLVLSLHFDGFASEQARGATGYCAPATAPASARTTGELRAAAVVLLPWRDVAIRHAVESRAFAEAVLSALELRGLGPARLRERLPFGLLGINAPGIVLECATLTSPGDRERVLQEQGLRELAASIADGVEAYQRNP